MWFTLKSTRKFKLEHRLNYWSVNIVYSNFYSPMRNQEKPVIEKRLESTDRT